MTDGISLALFSHRMEAICAQMGAALQRAALSPNIRDRLDFSCALFDGAGRLIAQAAHIPVHLGSMGFAMQGLVRGIDWRDGDQVVVNDPYSGGTHLPDVTVIAPLFHEGRCLAFVANRAHHADVGAEAPGSMPLSRRLDEEGLVLAPTVLWRDGQWCAPVLARIRAACADADGLLADLAAQASANRRGLQRLAATVNAMGAAALGEALAQRDAYGRQLAQAALAQLPTGRYRFVDYLEDPAGPDGRLAIRVALQRDGDRVRVDFAGTAAQAPNNLNCPLPVTAAAVHYVLRCLMPAQTPACAGTFEAIDIAAPPGSLVNARAPAAVAAGNVETSSRIVDVVLGALAEAMPDRIPAASHGSMNNLAMGGRHPRAWSYYETMGGGMGAGATGGGLAGVQTHMTNTRNTPVELLESVYPLRVERYALRRGTGGAGQRRGGDGLYRCLRLLAPAEATLLTERRALAPWGLAGGEPGAAGYNRLNGQPLPAKAALRLAPGDVLELASAGGGGFGPPPPVED
ncbi:MAG: hydantoinase B/oxoprolinase family protein [Pseudomonadota bacterium]|nr:hydantoinase B/oxoprolinase family protein [Pseudomonadota bacterium]